MPFARPTLTQLRTQARSDVASQTASGTLLRFANLGIIGDMLAGLANGLYGYLDWIAQQATPFTATDEAVIAGWAALKNIYQKQPQAAGLQVAFNGTAGSTIPADTPVVRLLDGFQFTTGAQAVVNGQGLATASVVASSAGAAGNTTAGAAMVLGASVLGVQPQGVAGSTTSAGVDLEPLASFRARMLQAYAQPPRGGDAADYINWAESVAGVTRAWVAPGGMGPGTVIVYFMMDLAEAGHGGFPQGSNGVAASDARDTVATGDQLSVANYVFSQCNITASPYACAPTPNTVTITITGLANAGSAVQNAIQAAVANVFMASGSPGGVRSTNGTPAGVIELSAIQGAIEGVSGSAGYVITALTASAGSGSPTANVSSNFGCLPTLAPIVFQ